MRSWTCVAPVAAVVGCLLIAGCRGGNEVTSESSDVLGRDPVVLSSQGDLAQRMEGLPADLNDAGVAAKLVAMMPRLSSLKARQEIELLGAIHRHGVDAAGSECDEILLAPPTADLPSRLHVSERELLLRILAEVHVPDMQVTWASNRATIAGETSTNEHDHSCMLTSRIIGRTPEFATVEAEITARLSNGQGWAQRLEATWDGLQWMVKPAGLRLSW